MLNDNHNPIENEVMNPVAQKAAQASEQANQTIKELSPQDNDMLLKNNFAQIDEEADDEFDATDDFIKTFNQELALSNNTMQATNNTHC